MFCCCADEGLVESGKMTISRTNEPSARKYRSYPLRLWRVDTPDHGWRVSLEDPRTGQRIGFGTLEQLFAFLMEQVERDEQGERME